MIGNGGEDVGIVKLKMMQINIILTKVKKCERNSEKKAQGKN